MKEVLTMQKLADHIIAITNKNNLLITNLQLQVVLYLTLKYIINKNLLNQKELLDLYDAPFQVWRYGATNKIIYEKYKKYFSDVIIEDSKEYKRFDPLNDYIIALLQKDYLKLLDKTKENPFWQKHQNEIVGWRSNINYSLQDIAK